MNSRQPQDLFGLNFRIALTAIDPRFGTIEAFKVTEVYGEKQIDKINLINCRELYDDERWEYFLGFSRIKQILDKGEDIVCPDVDNIDVQNEHGDTIFSYFLINIVQCNYTAEDNDCITDD